MARAQDGLVCGRTSWESWLASERPVGRPHCRSDSSVSTVTPSTKVLVEPSECSTEVDSDSDSAFSSSETFAPAVPTAGPPGIHCWPVAQRCVLVPVPPPLVPGYLDAQPLRSLSIASSTDTAVADPDTLSDIGSDTSELAVAHTRSLGDLHSRLKDFCGSGDESESLAYSLDCDEHSVASDFFDFDDLEKEDEDDELKA